MYLYASIEFGSTDYEWQNVSGWYGGLPGTDALAFTGNGGVYSSMNSMYPDSFTGSLYSTYEFHTTFMYHGGESMTVIARSR